MTDHRREIEPEIDPVLAGRFSALATVGVPDVWADATARSRASKSLSDSQRSPSVDVVVTPVEPRGRRSIAPWVARLAAVAALVGVIALIAAVRRPITQAPDSAPTTTQPALTISPASVVVDRDRSTIEIEIAYRAEDDDGSVPNAVYVLREGAAFPEAIAFTGCLARDDIQTKLIQPSYAIEAGFAEATECGIGSIALAPGDRATITITTTVLPAGAYRVALGGWSSDLFEVVVPEPTTTVAAQVPSPPAEQPQFTELSLQELPDGYSFESAVRDDTGDIQVGMVRFVGPAGQPDLVLILRATPDFFATPIELGRETWPVNGRTVVNDGEGDGRCLPDVCSVGVQWDDTTAVSVMWWAPADTGVELGPEHTHESLVVIAATLMDVASDFYTDGSIAPDEA